MNYLIIALLSLLMGCSTVTVTYTKDGKTENLEIYSQGSNIITMKDHNTVIIRSE